MSQGVRIGSLCTGYGGLDMAVMQVFGGQLTWCADNERHVAALLAARYKGIPNLGDLTALDWSQVETAEIICVGFPCQDISYAGSGAGIERGTRSGIWINIVAGIRLLAPKIIIVENVAALRRRGLDRVLGDLAALGYDAVWTSLRASDVGAAHRRERVFVLAYRSEARELLTATDASRQRWARWPARRYAPRQRPPSGSQRPGPDLVSSRTASGDAAGMHNPSGGRTDSGDGVAWGTYELAIRRWEAITARPAPQPTERGTRGQTRLAAGFSEWLMGLPKGFVTDLNLPYGAQHRVLGNGVVPQQAIAALTQLTALAVKQLAADEECPSRAKVAS